MMYLLPIYPGIAIILAYLTSLIFRLEHSGGSPAFSLDFMSY